MYSSCVGIITFLLGLFLGHRLTLGRDKRKERITASKPIRTWIIKRKKSPTPNHQEDKINDCDLDNYLLTLSTTDRNKFKKIYDDYLIFVESEDNQVWTNPNSGHDIAFFVPFSSYKDERLFLKKLNALDKITRQS